MWLTVVCVTCWYLVATVSISGHWFGKNKEWILLTKFINHIDNTLHYKSQVELSIQMSYSNCILYQNVAATRAHDAATTTLPPLQPLIHAMLCHRMIPGFLKSQCNVNGTKCYVQNCLLYFKSNLISILLIIRNLKAL